MGLFDKLGIGSGRSFYARDFRNAYHLRPDINPPRQKFQGYVNFILNRDSALFGSLFGSIDNSVFRTQISSLVRKASLPDLTFKTEIKNSYNRKKVIQTGVDYDPVSITVMDTVGNEWLALLMNYYSYHFMNPRNKSLSADRDPRRPASTDTLMQSSQFGSKTPGGAPGAGPNIDIETSFNSNSYGYNTNLDPNFFERIDLILYHGNKGVQYSLMNPVLKSLKTSDLDYSSSDIMEYDLTFDYENFVPYSVTNFQLSGPDVQRFEQAYKFVGPAFDAGRQPVALRGNADSTGTTLTFLGGIEGEGKQRTKQPEVPKKPPESAPQTSAAPPPIDSELAGSPEYQSKVASSTTVDSNQLKGNQKSALPDVYGNAAQFSKATGKSKKQGFLENLVGNAAGAAIGAALSGRNVKNAVVGSAIGTSLSAVSSAVNNRQRPPKPAESAPARPPENSPSKP